MKKTATFMRMIHEASAPPENHRKEKSAWWVNAALFRVSPAMEFTTYDTFRKGKLLKNDRFMRRFGWDRRQGRKLEVGEMFKIKPDPMYSHRQVHRTTAFVISSASDLATMMDRSNKLMVKMAEERLEFLKGVEDGVDKQRMISQQEETIRLFPRTDRMGFDIETYLFPARKDATWKNGCELDGSQRGTLDLAKPFIDMGYTVVGLPELPPRPYEMTEPQSI